MKRGLWVGAAVGALVAGTPAVAWAQTQAAAPGITVTLGPGPGPNQAVSLLALLALLSLLPAILVTMTAFTRIVTVLSFTRSALGLQNTPPNQVLIGLALFLTLFVMSPTLNAINHQALQPYLHNQLTLTAAIGAAMGPLRTFMDRQTRPEDLALFLHLLHLPPPHSLSQVPTTALIPAFIISELRTAFEIGIYIYIPFVIIDLVVSTILMSMGMMMVPPTLISLPLKLLVFVLANGWDLVVQSLVLSFH
ncbi:MAG: flagellar type III secretion system pore protein FliP [Firmicutes bacterium]|nr:flagellar type III secretion system pore protein FliP [Alicyclobacillaceae bacterium]MCL6497303.1 flagellar type III secretion system pore protein FliP [Bacillota bacterium]